MTYTKHRDTQETLAILDTLGLDDAEEHGSSMTALAEKFGLDEQDFLLGGTALPWYRKMRPKVWQLLEEPRSSTAARIISVISIFFICVSISTFCFMTYPSFRVPNLIQMDDGTNSSVPFIFKAGAIPHPAFTYSESVCNVWFTFELIARFLVSPNRREFMASGITIIDFLATLSFYMDLIVHRAIPNMSSSTRDLLEFFSITRIMRLLKLVKHSSGLRVLLHSFKASGKVLILLVFFVVLGVVIFASLIYYAERITNQDSSSIGMPNDFTSIIDALWFAVVTMATIGFGDMVPRTMFGMFFGAICAVTGVLMIGLPMPIIVETFTNYYTHTQARSKLPKQRRRVVTVEPARPAARPKGALVELGAQMVTNTAGVSRPHAGHPHLH